MGLLSPKIKRYLWRFAVVLYAVAFVKIFYQAIVFFSPLIISTLLCVLAFTRLGPLREESQPSRRTRPLFWRPSPLHDAPNEVYVAAESSSDSDGRSLEAESTRVYGLTAPVVKVTANSCTVENVEELKVKDRSEIGTDSSDDEEQDRSEIGTDSSDDEEQEQVSEKNRASGSNEHNKSPETVGIVQSDEHGEVEYKEVPGDIRQPDGSSGYDFPDSARHSVQDDNSVYKHNKEASDFDPYMDLFVESVSDFEDYRHFQHKPIPCAPALFRASKRCFLACFMPHRRRLTRF